MPSGQLDSVLRHLRRVKGVFSTQELTDGQLLERYAACRDPDAFATLVRRYGRLVRSVCWRVLSHHQDTDDAFQATFLVFATKAASIRKTAALASWLYGVAYRTAMNAKRVRTRQSKPMREPEGCASTQPVSEAALREIQRILDEELNQLAEKYRTPFILCCLCGKSKTEAAKELGCKEGTISSRLARARQELQRRLTRRGVGLTAALCGIDLTRAAAQAVTPALVNPTIQAALSFAAGKAATADLVSAPVAALAKGVLQSMWTTKLKIATALLLTAGCVFGAGWLTRQTPAAQAEDGQKPAAKTPQEQKASAASKPAADPKGDRESAVIRGQVLGPLGKPFPGAKVYLWTAGVNKEKAARTERATTDQDGRFRFTATKAELVRQGKVVVMGKGYGPDWSDLKSTKSANLSLRLVKDDVPIDGRVLDLEGQPLAGVTFEVARLEQGDLKGWFKARKQGWSGNLLPKEIAAEALGRPTTVTTGKDGRIQLTGFGRDRVIQVRLRGDHIEHCDFWVVTRNDPPRGLRVGPYGTYGAKFNHFARPSKPIIGTVRDRATGKPLAGIDVISSYYNNRLTKTDAKGRYRIVGAGKYDQYSVSAGGTPYFNCTKMNIADTPGLDPLRVDFELDRGIAVKGRLTDKATGKPVPGRISYVPLADNTNLKNYADLGKLQVLATDSGRTKADGSFTVTSIPGPGLLLARADDDGRFLAAEPVGVRAASNIILQGTYHAIVPINASEKDSRSITHHIALISGKSIKGIVLGPDGRPLAGACAAGLSPMVPFSFGRSGPAKMAAASFTAGGLDPQKPRALVFVHIEKKLAKVQHLNADQSGPVKVRLEPLGALAGRILDAAGKPLVGLKVSAMMSYRPGSNKQLPADLHVDRYTWSKLTDGKATTDKNGMFRVDGLVPGIQYVLNVKRDAEFLTSCTRDGLTVEAGNTKNLGELKDQPPAKKGAKGKP